MAQDPGEVEGRVWEEKDVVDGTSESHCIGWPGREMMVAVLSKKKRMSGRCWIY